MNISKEEYLQWLWKLTAKKCEHSNPRLIKHSDSYYEIVDYSQEDLINLDTFADVLIFKYNYKVKIGDRMYDH